MDNKILDRYRQMMGVSHGYTYEYFDYLEHTGRGEYIILPYHPNEKTYLKFKYSVPTNTDECILFGSRNRLRTTTFYYLQNNVGGSIMTKTGGGSVNFGNTYIYDWYDVDPVSPAEWVRKRPGTSTADQTRTWDGTVFTVDYNMYLFAINHNDGVIGSGAHDSKVNLVAGVKMSAIELYEDQTLLMYLRPARRSDGRTGYHDTLNNVFYSSENEYDFNVGNYADEYIYYDYLESTGTNQYVDTGLFASSDLSINCRCFGRSGYTNLIAFGGRTTNGVAEVSLRLQSPSPGFNNRITSTYNNTKQKVLGMFVPEEIYDISYSKTEVSVTGSQGTSGTVTNPGTSFLSTKHVNLFGFNNTSTPGVAGVCIGECKMYENSVLKRNYKPSVRRYDGKTGMFDSVDDVLYQSYTGVNFAYGNWS